MAANPSIANPNLIPKTQEAIAEPPRPKMANLLERTDQVLRRAFGKDDETITNSLRGL
jgi:hypothetical protein